MHWYIFISQIKNLSDIGTYACKFQISIFFSFNVFISTFEILFPTFLHRKFDLVVYLEIQSNLLVTLSILPVRAFLFFFCTLIKRKFSDFFLVVYLNLYLHGAALAWLHFFFGPNIANSGKSLPEEHASVQGNMRQDN